MSLPKLNTVTQEQAITDMIEALALQEAALASLIEAEACKVDALVAAGIPAAQSVGEVNDFQAAIANVLQVATNKGQQANSTLELVRAILAQRVDKPRF